jgi:Asp-tRNA(Asn)/Glu-tRNA(Gln) amidotransferase B subunit
MQAAEDERLKNAISASYGFGMGLMALIGATMRYLEGKANPAQVRDLAKNYLENGHRFK